MSELDNLAGGIAAVGVGGAMAAAIAPVMEPARQAAWAEEPNRVLGLNEVARLVAQALITFADAGNDAKRQGFNENKLRAAIQLAFTAPDTATALNLWRRGLINDTEVRHSLHKAQIEPAYIPAILGLKGDILSPGELAAAIHRGLVPDPGLLQGEQPKPPFTVDAYPVYQIPAVAEAAGSGYDKDRLGVLVGLQGLPMGTHEAAQALFRGIITHGDYIRAFNESNSRNEWAEAVLEYTRQIPTARDFFENALRGYHTLAWAQQQAERHGMSHEDSLVIYQNQGRPMNIRQITQALSRGGVFNPEPGELTDPYDASVVEGNIKPAYYELAKALKYTLPSPFVMRSLTASGVWSEAKAAQRLKDSGWIPEDADEAAKAWATPASGTASSHVGKAETQLWSTLHASYKAFESDDTTATEGFNVLGIPAAEQPRILELWRAERDLVRKQLTAAQVKKAYQKAVMNDATGAPWTRDDALNWLVTRGWERAEATTFLAE